MARNVYDILLRKKQNADDTVAIMFTECVCVASCESGGGALLVAFVVVRVVGKD